MHSVPERIEAVGIEPTNDFSWAVGAAVREEWRRRHGGELPAKGLRRKTHGEGSHCFAVYPDEFVPVMDEIIRSAARARDAEQRRQGRLF